MSLLLSICALVIGILTNSVNGVPQYSREYLSPVIGSTGASNWYTTNRETGTISEKPNKDSFTFIDSSEVRDVNPPLPVAHRTPEQQRVSFQKDGDPNGNSSRQISMKDGRRMRNASRSRSLLSQTGDFNIDFAVHSQNGTLKVVYPTRNPNNNYDIITQESRVRLPDDDDDEEELTTSRRGKRESDIVFPNDTDTNYHDMPPSAYLVPKCKPDEFLCADVDNYPEEYINNVVKEEEKRYRDFFGVDKLTQANITSRIGAPGDQYLCDSTEELIFPKQGLTSQDKWKLIVNTANFTQGIRVEKCTRHKFRCNYADSFPNGYEPICEQKFISRQLVSFSERGKTATDQFKIPSCCNCVLKNSVNGGSHAITSIDAPETHEGRASFQKGDAELPSSHKFNEDLLNYKDTHQIDVLRNAELRQKCQAGETVCTDVDSYPENDIDNIVKEQANEFRHFNIIDVLTVSKIYERIEDDNTQYLCDTIEELIFPKLGLTRKGEWKFIVNTANFTQGVRIQKCYRQQKPCYFANVFPNGVEPLCEEEFIIRRLVSISEHGKFEVNQFKIPSCCRCVLKIGRRKHDQFSKSDEIN